MQLQYDKNSPNSIEAYAAKLKGHCLTDVLTPAELAEIKAQDPKGTGKFGLMIEKFYFGIEPNNRPEPDFVEAGVELKTAGVIKRKTGLYLKSLVWCLI